MFQASRHLNDGFALASDASRADGGVFVWNTQPATPVNYSNWFPGEPNNSGYEG